MKITSRIIKDLKNKKITEYVKNLATDYEFYSSIVQDILKIIVRGKVDQFTIIYVVHVALHFEDLTTLEKLYRVKSLKLNKSMNACYVKAKMCFALDRYVEAEAFFARVSAGSISLMKPGDFALYNECAFRIGAFNKADAALMLALEKFPDDIFIKIIALNYQLKRAGRNPRQLELAKNNYEYLRKFAPPTDHSFELGTAAFGIGKTNEGIQFFENATANALTQKQINSSGKKFDEGQTLESMNEIISLLNEQGLTCFPAFGSLLGLVREGTLLPHDKDADIGVICDPTWKSIDYLNIISRICAKSKFAAPSVVVDAANLIQWNIGIFDTERGSSVDLFFFRSVDNLGLCAGIATIFGRLLWQKPEFRLSPQVYGNATYMAPTDVNEHLSSIYGKTWGTPIKKWDSLISCENITSCSRDVSIFFALQRRFDAARKRDYTTIEYYEKELKRVWNLEVSSVLV